MNNNQLLTSCFSLIKCWVTAGQQVCGECCSAPCLLPSFHRHWWNFFYFMDQRSSLRDGWKWAFSDIDQSKGVASARLAKLKMRVCFFLFLNKKFDNVLEIEALSLHRVCIGTMNKINPSFLLLELHQQLRRNGKWLCRWLSGSVPDKEEVWIKDDCSSFTLSPGEEEKKADFYFLACIVRRIWQCRHWLLFVTVCG